MTRNPDVLERLAPLSGAPSRGFEDLLRRRAKRELARKIGAIAVVAVLILALLGIGLGTLDDRTERPAQPPQLSPGTLHVFKTLDPAFDSSYRITMPLLDGYRGQYGGVVFGTDEGQGISAWLVGNVYAKPCRWVGTLLNPPIDQSVGGLVAGLTNQKRRHATAATDVTLSGFTGKYMELTVPARIDLAKCAYGQFRTWVDPTLVGARWLEPGQRDLLWIIDVDGTRLVIDAALGPDTTRKDRADRIEMVESIRIEPD
jgi:hypothetical protein